MTLGILLGGLGFMASAAGWCLLLREQAESKILREALEVQLSCLRGTLEKIEDSSEGIEFGLARADEFLRVGPERGSVAAKAVQQASKEASSTRRFCREFRRALQVTRQTVSEESTRQRRRETPIRILAGDRDAWSDLVASADAAEQRLAA